MKPAILIIEDEPALRALMKEYLEFEGFEVVVAADGTEALEAAQTRDFALAFVDINLPDVSGDEVMRRLRQQGSAARFVVLSGNIRESYENLIRDLDVHRVLEKPVDLNVLSELASEATRPAAS